MIMFKLSSMVKKEIKFRQHLMELGSLAVININQIRKFNSVIHMIIIPTL